MNEEMCQFNGSEVEDVAHALCYYLILQECWDKYRPIVRLVGSYKLYGDIACHLSGMRSRGEVELFLLLSWSCWYRRNLLTFENKCLQHEQAIGHALAMQEAFKETNGKPLKLVRHHYHWEHPPRGVLEQFLEILGPIN